MPSVFDVLGTDHQEVKRMLSELEKGPAGLLQRTDEWSTDESSYLAGQA